MALTRLDSQMIEVPATISDLTVNNLQSPVLNNAVFWDQAYNTILANQINWDLAYETATVVQATSSTWTTVIPVEISNLLTTVTVNSGNWYSAYTAFSTTSSNFALSTDIIPTTLNYLQTNEIEISATKTSEFILQPTLTLPSLSSDPGVEGTIKWDTDYLYICIGEDTWKRVALSAW